MVKKAKPKKATDAKPITDVAHESQSAPSSSSRPIIVTNRPVLRDPMISNEIQSDKNTKELALQPPGKHKLQPSVTPEPVQSEQTWEDLSEPKTEPEATAPLETATVASAGTLPNKNEPAETSLTVEASDTEAVATKETEHDSKVQKLVDTKQYFLPINTIEKRRSKRFVALGILLSFLLAVAWVDISLDAGLIRLHGIKPLTHFFST